MPVPPAAAAEISLRVRYAPESRENMLIVVMTARLEPLAGTTVPSPKASVLAHVSLQQLSDSARRTEPQRPEGMTADIDWTREVHACTLSGVREKVASRAKRPAPEGPVQLVLSSFQQSGSLHGPRSDID
jgi:hypothetical protein